VNTKNTIFSTFGELVSRLEKKLQRTYAGVYFDYCSRKSIVAFQGSDFIKDWGAGWWANAGQYTQSVTDQYDKAMDIGFWIYGRKGLIDHVIFTGHSLGGGLASAAMALAVPEGYVTAPGEKKAITFNAAGLRGETLDKFIKSMDINGTYAKNNYANGINLALAFYVEGEILDTIQSIAPPRAFGGKQVLNHNWTLNQVTISVILSLLGGVPGVLAAYLGNRGLLHLMEDSALDGCSVMGALERRYGIRLP
jgi:hypothetical protein